MVAFLLFVIFAHLPLHKVCAQFPTVAFTIAKTRILEQVSPTGLIPSSPAAFSFQAIVQSGFFDVMGGSIAPPDTGNAPFTLELSDDGTYYTTTTFMPDESALQTAFPDGTYVANLQTNFGAVSVSVSLPAHTYPTIPLVTNFTQAQTICPDYDFVLTFSPFAGAGTADFLALDISDEAGAVLFRLTPSDIATTATSARIPANTLVPNRTYHGQIVFAHVVSSTDGFFSESTRSLLVSATFFSVKTISAGTAALRVEVLPRTPDGYFTFRYNAVVGGSYEVQTSPNLLNWTTVLTQTATECPTVFIDTQSVGLARRYYRIVSH